MNGSDGVRLWSAVGVGLLLGACAEAHRVNELALGERPRGEAPMQTVEPSAQSLAIMQHAEQYAHWPVFTGLRERPVRSRGHENMWVIAYYNSAATEAMARDDMPFPDGSILVKENRPEADAPTLLLTTMAKVDGQWHWIEHTPEGGVVVEDGLAAQGQLARCIGCHADAPRDMVFGSSLP
jgi:hypothetical protein